MFITNLKEKILELVLNNNFKITNFDDETSYILNKKIDEEKIRFQQEINNQKNINEKLNSIEIEKLIDNVSTVGKEVKTKNVLKTGQYKVISQSQQEYDGFSNDITKLITCTPIILFGDHTKVVKYINEPFVPGADGTKIFKPKCYAKYLFYLIKYASIKIENRGYGRHCALLKTYRVSYCPKIEKQIEISCILDYVFYLCDLIENETKDINILRSKIKKKIIQLIFSNNSPYKSYYEEKYRIGDILEYVQPGPYIVSSTKYDDSFKTPVLTPGKTFILGYTNEENGIFNASKNKKVIIFDDFTTASRIVDFCFKVKSSAMKILKNINSDKFNIEYMFYLLQTININNDSHKRFWISEYAPKFVSVHCLKEQIQIVNYINDLFSLLDSI